MFPCQYILAKCVHPPSGSINRAVALFPVVRLTMSRKRWEKLSQSIGKALARWDSVNPGLPGVASRLSDQAIEQANEVGYDIDCSYYLTTYVDALIAKWLQQGHVQFASDEADVPLVTFNFRKDKLEDQHAMDDGLVRTNPISVFSSVCLN